MERLSQNYCGIITHWMRRSIYTALIWNVSLGCNFTLTRAKHWKKEAVALKAHLCSLDEQKQIRPSQFRASFTLAVILSNATTRGHRLESNLSRGDLRFSFASVQLTFHCCPVCSQLFCSSCLSQTSPQLPLPLLKKGLHCWNFFLLSFGRVSLKLLASLLCRPPQLSEVQLF